jgi:hypothetical protein
MQVDSQPISILGQFPAIFAVKEYEIQFLKTNQYYYETDLP